MNDSRKKKRGPNHMKPIMYGVKNALNMNNKSGIAEENISKQKSKKYTVKATIQKKHTGGKEDFSKRKKRT